MSSRIEQLIGEIEEFIDGCKLQPFSSTKIIVDKAQLEELLVELRHRTPDEIKKYQKILNNKEAIINDAKAQAEAIIEAANVQTNELVNQHEIVQRAYAKANEIIEEAKQKAKETYEQSNDEATAIHNAAMAYTDDLIGSVQTIISTGMDGLKENYEAMMGVLQEHYDMLVENRRELIPSEEEPEKETPNFDSYTLEEDGDENEDADEEE